MPPVLWLWRGAGEDREEGGGTLLAGGGGGRRVTTEEISARLFGNSKRRRSEAHTLPPRKRPHTASQSALSSVALRVPGHTFHPTRSAYTLYHMHQQPGDHNRKLAAALDTILVACSHDDVEMSASGEPL